VEALGHLGIVGPLREHLGRGEAHLLTLGPLLGGQPTALGIAHTSGITDESAAVTKVSHGVTPAFRRLYVAREVYHALRADLAALHGQVSSLSTAA